CGAIAGIPGARRGGRARWPGRRRAGCDTRLHQAAPAVRQADRQLPGAAAPRRQQLHRRRAQPLAGLSRARGLRCRRASPGDGVGCKGACLAYRAGDHPRGTADARSDWLHRGARHRSLLQARADAGGALRRRARPYRAVLGAHPRNGGVMSGAGATEAAVLRAVDRRGIATLTLNRPEKGNSYSPAMLDALLDAVRRLGADPAVRALVLRGSGRHFSAGAEIGAPAAKDKPRTSIAALCLELDSVAKPIIALVHGGCIGGAVALISCCDMVIAARNAFFSLPEVRLGFPPASLIPFFLRAIDARALRRYLLSGERFSADEALRIGLVHQLCA